MKFDVTTSPSLAKNALLGGDRKAAERQTPAEHDALLDYTNLPEYGIIMALPAGPEKDLKLAMLKEKAIEREKEFPKYWDDKTPRRYITQSSSFIGDIDYDPNSRFLMVQLGNKAYPYANKTPDDVANWVNSYSMEKYFNDYVKGKS